MRARVYQPRPVEEIPLYRGVGEAWHTLKYQQDNMLVATRTTNVPGVVGRLRQIIELTDHQAAAIGQTIERHITEGRQAFRATPYYLRLMAANPFAPEYNGQAVEGIDPIFLQAVPTPADFHFPDAGHHGAMAEESRSIGAVYQRYWDRVAFFVANNESCPVRCKHCQRGNSLDAAKDISNRDIELGLAYIRDNPNIEEVLVTGGDALNAGSRLGYVLEQLSRIDHIETLRIATRLPVTLPMGVTDQVLDTIVQKSGEKTVYFVTHANHPHEITEEFAAAAYRITSRGFRLRNQTVLLRHVNDDPATLTQLFKGLFNAGVDPYYLFQCHNESGISHLITPLQQGQLLMRLVQGTRGTTLPKFRMNAAGGAGKVNCEPSGVGEELSDLEVLGGSQRVLHGWDSRIHHRVEELGAATSAQFKASVSAMRAFGWDDYRPCVILRDRGDKVTNLGGLKKLERLLEEKRQKERATKLGFQEPHITNPATEWVH